MIGRQAEDLCQDLRFREALVFRIHPRLPKAGGNQILGILTIQNGVILGITHPVGMTAQNPVSHMVKGSSPQPGKVVRQKGRHPGQHLLGGFICKSEQEDLFRCHSLFDQIGHPISQGTGLAAASPRDHQNGPRRGRYRFQLLRIQLSGVVDTRSARRPTLLP